MFYDSDQDFDKEPGGCDGYYNEDEEIWYERQLKFQELKDKFLKIKEAKELEIEILKEQIKTIDKRIKNIDKKMNLDLIPIDLCEQLKNNKINL